MCSFMSPAFLRVNASQSSWRGGQHFDEFQHVGRIKLHQSIDSCLDRDHERLRPTTQRMVGQVRQGDVATNVAALRNF